MSDPAVFGQWMKQLRAARDLTQEQLAELVGCAGQTIRLFETGRRRPSGEMARRLADTLEVPSAQREQFCQAARAGAPPPSQPDLAHALPHPLARRSRLPQAPNELIGREAELASIAARLTDKSSRLVNIVGPGGIGKTRLALEAAKNLVPRFADGAVWVAPEPQGGGLASVVAAALAAPPGDDPLAALTSLLADRELLLVIDSVESASDSADTITAILAAAPAVRVLVTSRERLQLQREWVVEPGGLPVPGPEGQAIDQAPAALLFTERARQVDQGFELTRGNSLAVARICRILDGSPLGIELAAAWVDTLTPDEIAAELVRGLDFLGAAGRLGVARRPDLRAVFERSWRILSPVEQNALARLSVFRGGCRAPTATTIAGASLTTVAALIDKSLLRRATDKAGGSRYDLHELVRQYAAERLASTPGAVTETRDRHCAYYAALLADARPQLQGQPTAALLAELAAESENLRLAWEWALGRNDYQTLQKMAGGRMLLAEIQGRLREGAELLEESASRLSATRSVKVAVGDEHLFRQAQGELLALAGWLHGRSGGLSAACTLLERAIDLPGPEATLDTGIDLQSALGLFLGLGGYYTEARQMIENCLFPSATQALAYAHLALVNHYAGDATAADAAYAAAEPLARAEGAGRGLIHWLLIGALIANERGEPARAEERAREALRAGVARHDRWGMGVALCQLGLAALAGGDLAEGRYLTREGYELLDELGDGLSTGRALIALGVAELANGDAAAARRAWLQALRLGRAAGLTPLRIAALARLAELVAAEGDEARAAALIQPALNHPAAEQIVRSRAQTLAASLAIPPPDPPPSLDDLVAGMV